MASEDEQIRKLLEGEMRVKTLTATLHQEIVAILQLDHALKAANASQNEINLAWSQATPKIAAMYQQLRVAQKDVTGSTRDMGSATLFASNALQDFQAAGLRGVLNNIPQILVALGASGGLAGVAMAVGVAFEAAKPFLDKFMESMNADRVGDFVAAIDKASKRLEELNKAAKLSAADKLEKANLERGIKEREAGLRAGEEESERIGAPGPAIGKAVAGVLAGSTSSKETLEKIQTASTKAMGEEAANKYERDMLAQMEKDIEYNRGMHGSARVYEPDIRKRYEKNIREGRGDARLEGERNARTYLGSLMKKAEAGDPAAIAELTKKLREAGNESLAAQIEDAAGRARLEAAGPMGPVDEMKSVRDDAERRRKEAGPITVPDLMKSVRDDAERRDREEQAQADAKEERERQQRESIASYNRRINEQRAREYAANRPDWHDPDRQESDLMRAMSEGTTDVQRLVSPVPLDQSRTRRGDRYKLRPTSWFSHFEYERRVNRELTLDEAATKLGEQRAAEIMRANPGMDPQVAREEGEKFGKQAYSQQMQRGYGAMKQIEEMAMTGQIGRGVQMMSMGQAIDSIQTAREGVDKQQLELSKKQTEALVYIQEWARVNGVKARVASGRKGRP